MVWEMSELCLHELEEEEKHLSMSGSSMLKQGREQKEKSPEDKILPEDLEL